MQNKLRYHVKLSAETNSKIQTLAALMDSKSISIAIETAISEIYDEYFPKIESA